ncbi:MAG TPA: VTT domain-containing protein [Rhizomicrobium sp.]|nr:VTT domain-containing protein [Rhizomicrobium sp.]
MRLPITVKSIAIALVVAAIFVGVSLLAHRYEHALGGVVKAGGVWGIAAFIVVTAILTVFLVPLDVSVLVPLAAAAWGPVGTAFMSDAGWTWGSAIAFFLARRFGAPVVARVVGKRRLREAERTARRTIPKHHLFWWALVSQALLPVDLISYAFGLFADIALGWYVLATAIGDLVPGFFFAYAGVLPVWYQIGALIAALAIAGLLFWHSRAEARG